MIKIRQLLLLLSVVFCALIGNSSSLWAQTAYDLTNAAFFASISRTLPYATGFIRHPELVQPLFDVIASGSLEDVAEILNQGASIKSKINQGQTVMDAVLERNLNNPSDPEVMRIAEFLLEKGADVDSLRIIDTPLLKAIQQDNYELVKLLLEHGATLNVTDSQSGIALPFIIDQIQNAAIRDLLINALQQAYDRYCVQDCPEPA